MFNFPKCRHCNATLPIATGICPHCTQLSPPPAQESPGESIAAPAEVGQGMGPIAHFLTQIFFPLLMCFGILLCIPVTLFLYSVALLLLSGWVGA